MVFSVPLPPDASDAAIVIWHDIAESLTVGSIEKLHDAIKDFIALSAKDKKILEDMASSSVLPYPGLPPMLITEIFTNPEATVGIIERLGPDFSTSQLAANLGTAEQAIVLDALIAWLKSEQRIALTAHAEAKQEATKEEAKKEEAVNPLNTALQSYIATNGAFSGPLNMGSLQFLKNNSISLAGLNIADPTLLNQAYQVASQQLLITLLPEINTSNLTAPSAEASKEASRLDATRIDASRVDPSKVDTTSEQSRSNTIQRHLVDEIRKALQEGAIPLNMQTYLVLWTAITLPMVQSTDSTTASKNPSTQGHDAISNSSANVVAASSEDIAKSGFLPSSPVVASILASFPVLYTDQINQAGDPGAKPDGVIDQLGMLSYIYSQMAPYWSGPAAVSLMAATKGGEMTEQKKLESSVRAFAISLGALLNDVSFDKLLTALLKRASPGMSEEQLKVFIAAMKISILTNALIALYIVLLRKNNGQFRADELAQLILGPPLDERIDLDDLQKGLIKSIQTELRYIPSAQREEFVKNLLSAYSENTDINSLVDPTKQFLNLCDQTLNLDKASHTKG